MNMEIQPVYVKESPPLESAVGAGWASRTWEREMVQQGKAEISELINPEKDFCPVLREPKVVYGDREIELLKITQADEFDLFVEGVHFPWAPSEIHKRLHSKLYQKISNPVILVRTLRKVNQVQLLCLDMNGTEILTKVFQKIWKNCSVPLTLNWPAAYVAETERKKFRGVVDQAIKLLTESGCTINVRDTLSPNPRDCPAEASEDCSLVAIATERGITKDSLALQWLNEVKTSSLLAFY
jgi:hypothetical protein